MTEVTVDAVLREKLLNLSDSLELCDSSGRLLGRFIPTVDLGRYVPYEPQISEREIQSREQSTEWSTTAEVLAHLEKL